MLVGTNPNSQPPCHWQRYRPFLDKLQATISGKSVLLRNCGLKCEVVFRVRWGCVERRKEPSVTKCIFKGEQRNFKATWIKKKKKKAHGITGKKYLLQH